MKIRPVEIELFQVDEQTDGWDETFPYFVNTLKDVSICWRTQFVRKYYDVRTNL